MSLVLLAAVAAAAPDAPTPSWNRLYSERAAATSFLESNWNKYTENYHPSYALDGDPATAWVEGVDGDGVGSVLSWDVSALSSARALKLRIRNGYQKSDGLLAANAAPRDVVIRVWQGRQPIVEHPATLARAKGWQEIVIPLGGRGFNHLELEIRTVHPGSRYRDTVISDVETWVDSEVAYNQAVEQRKHAALTAWIRERVQTAAYFASLPPTYPFVATRFTQQQRGDATHSDAATHEAVAEPLRALLRRSPSGGPWFRDTVKDTSSRLPDGLWLLDEDVMRYLRAGDVTLFEARERRRAAPVDHEPDQLWLENLAVVKEEGRLLTLAQGYRWVHEGRSVSETTGTRLLAYDPAGHLVAILDQHTRGEDWELGGVEEVIEEVLQLRWSGDQIDQIVQHKRTLRTTRRAEPGQEAVVERDPPVHDRVVWAPAS